MAEYGQDVVVGEVQQGVVEDDPLVLPEAEEVGVAVARALGPVDLEELREGKVHLRGQGLDLGLQLLVLQRLELVVEGLDHVGVDQHEREDEHLAESPQVEVGLLAEAPHDPDQHRNQQTAEKVRDQLAFDQVREEEFHRHLVEAVPLLHDEVGVERDRDAQRLVPPLLQEQPEQRRLVLGVAPEDADAEGPEGRAQNEKPELLPSEAKRVTNETKEPLVFLVRLRLQELFFLDGIAEFRWNLRLSVPPELPYLQVFLQHVQHHRE
mmetsp:Transcript_46884/g.132208  ORF Transcript_46884/g.132208 Transcript_46884/m.132208 type:complete len:266 (-) Transcript_46884:96-893(-)